MKKIFLTTVIILMAFLDSNAQVEYKVITSVESLVSSGAGRSRIINATEEKNYQDFTTQRTDDKKSDKKINQTEVKLGLKIMKKPNF